MSEHTPTPSLTDIEHYVDTHPKARVKDIADALNISELTLLVSSGSVMRVNATAQDIFARLPELGAVKVITRNHAVVHELSGTYSPFKAMGANMGLFLGKPIDLRVFFRHIKHVCVMRPEPALLNRAGHTSVQFFDKDGKAVHKVFLTKDSKYEVLDDWLNRFGTKDAQTLAIKPVQTSSFNRPDSEIEADALRADWDGLRDVHDFFPMLKKHKVDREQALRVVGEQRAYQVQTQAVSDVLTWASEQAMPIMVFVGSLGVIQIYTGTVNAVKRVGDWFNVLDPDFNLHVLEPNIARCWVVKKPTKDGILTALECYDEHGLLLAQFFGQREQNHPENPKWRETVARLPKRSAE